VVVVGYCSVFVAAPGGWHLFLVGAAQWGIGVLCVWLICFFFGVVQ